MSDPNHPTGFNPASTTIINGQAVTINASNVTFTCFTMTGANAGFIIPLSHYVNDTFTWNSMVSDGTGNNINFSGIGSGPATNYSSNFTFTNNYIEAGYGAWVMCNSCLIRDNEIFNLHPQNSTVNPGDLDYVDLWGTGTTIDHNYMHGNACNSCNGFDCHMDCVQTFNTTGDGTEVSKNNTISRNVCFNHHEGLIAQDNAGNGDVGSWTVFDNVFAYGPYDNGQGHLCQAGTVHPWCWVFEQGVLGTGNHFYNNTCLDGSMGFRNATSGTADFKDNLFYSAGSLTTPWQLGGGTTTSGANNLLDAASGSISPQFTGDIVNQYPQFTSLGTGGASQQCIGCDFSVVSGSPAINAGVSTAPTVTIDLKGLSRPQAPATNYAIGAYELQAGASAPTVTTTTASSIGSTTASGGGNVTADGGDAVTARGTCYATSANPTTPCTSDGTGTGAFTSSLSGLSAGTTYHYRAFATNSVGTSYGTDMTFTTLAAPTVTTTTATSITSSTASSGGNVTSDGGATVTSRGVCYATSSNPTTPCTSDGTGAGTFTSSLSGLAASTLYHYRSFATNSVGTSYGSDLTFTTSAPSPTVNAVSTGQAVVSGQVR